MHYVSKVWSRLKIDTIYNNLINSFATEEQSLECYIKIFLIYSFNGKRGNFALQSEWEIVNSLLAAAKWGNQTLGRIYSLRSTLFSISMHSFHFLRYSAKNETLWRNSRMYFHSCQTYLSKSYSDMFLLYPGFNGMKEWMHFCFVLQLFMILVNRSFTLEIVKSANCQTSTSWIFTNGCTVTT